MTGRYKKMKKGKSWVIILVAVICIGLLGWYSTAVITDTKQKQEATANGESTKDKDYQNIKLGLDLSGGVSITYHIKDKNPSDKDVNDTIAKLEERAESYTTEYSVYKSGDDRITVEIPGVDDPNKVLEDLGSPGSLYFIAQYDSDGNANYTQDTSVEGGYKLNYDIDTLKANGSVILDGNDVKDASAQYDQSSSTSTKEPVVSLKLKDKAIDTWADATKKAKDAGQSIGIYYDDHFISVPTVSAVISDGNCVINGMKDYDEATSLATFIRVGAINLQLEELESNVVGAQLGGTALTNAVKAAIIGIILIMIFMIVLYGILGVVASIGLALYSMLTVLFIYWFEITLTLPGIAGIILGIGMGVDANVITAERIKEELGNGKTLDGAIASGFKMGLTPIIDGNVTIVIVAAILMGAFGPTDGFWAKVFNPIFYWFGPSTAGTIYSFGFTLLTSVLLNFVFGVWATRIMIRGAVHFKPLRKAWLFGGKKEGGADFKTPSINFIGNRKKFYTFSCALIAVVLVFCGIFGVKMDVEFKGGSMITLAYEGDADLNDLKSTIGTELGKSNLTLQTGSDISGNQTLTVTLPGSDTLTTEQLDNLLAALNEQYPDNNFVQNEVSNVDATIGKEFLLKSVVALVAACVLILLYVAYRFRKIGGLKAGSTAIVALLHDMFVVFGVFVLLRIPLNGNFIAALLTILGYSINDTVVIYDRIRENSALYGKKQMSLAELVNLSVNQSFARSLMTSITTCLALGVVCVVSVIYRLDSIYSFAFPLLFGMVSGVYSTICIATPLWVDWKNKKKAAKKA